MLQIERLRTLHELNILHRDLKPENIMVSSADKEHSNEIYLIDFGLAEDYLDK